MSAYIVKRAMRVKVESKLVLKGTPPWSGITQRKPEFPPYGRTDSHKYIWNFLKTVHEWCWW